MFSPQMTPCKLFQGNIICSLIPGFLTVLTMIFAGEISNLELHYFSLLTARNLGPPSLISDKTWFGNNPREEGSGTDVQSHPWVQGQPWFLETLLRMNLSCQKGYIMRSNRILVLSNENKYDTGVNSLGEFWATVEKPYYKASRV